jgi:hypothetical protein
MTVSMTVSPAARHGLRDAAAMNNTLPAFEDPPCDADPRGTVLGAQEIPTVVNPYGNYFLGPGNILGGWNRACRFEAGLSDMAAQILQFGRQFMLDFGDDTRMVRREFTIVCTDSVVCAHCYTWSIRRALALVAPACKYLGMPWQLCSGLIAQRLSVCHCRRQRGKRGS